MLMMNLEQRPVVFEDIGRQVLATGIRNQPEYYYEKIGKYCRQFPFPIVKLFNCSRFHISKNTPYEYQDREARINRFSNQSFI